MSRNRSHEPPKTIEQTLQMSSVNFLIQNLQSKVATLEKKYLEFVNHCTKIIKDAQSFLDQSIADHVLNNSSSFKIIENLTQQKQKLKEDLLHIQKMSQVPNKKSENYGLAVSVMKTISKAKEKILERIEENKQKYFIQGILLAMEEKLSNVIRKLTISSFQKDRIVELEEVLKTKENEIESLHQYVLKLKNENEKQFNQLQDLKIERRVTSPSGSSTKFWSGRTSPVLNSPKFKPQKDQEIEKLKHEISYLQDKFIGLTGTAQKLVKKKDYELHKFMNEKPNINIIKNMLKSIFFSFDSFEAGIGQKLENFGRKVGSLRILRVKVEAASHGQKFWRKKNDDAENSKMIKGLETIIEDLKIELIRKDEHIKLEKEEFARFSKFHSESNQKVLQIQKKLEEIHCENQKKDEKIAELTKLNSELKIENKSLISYKNEIDLEIMELKDYFQSDIDNLSTKIEKLFTENLALKQKNEDIREKYEKVLAEKEKKVMQMFETNKDLNSFDIKKSVRAEANKNNSALALKQELKIANFKLELKQKNFFQLKTDLSYWFSKSFIELDNNITKTQIIITEKLKMFSEKLSFLSARLQIPEKSFKNSKFLENRKNKENSLQMLKEKIEDLKVSESKFKSLSENLSQKCTNSQHIIEELLKKHETNKNCEKCEDLEKIVIEKDEIIVFLQEQVNILEKENTNLDKEIQNLEFTFQNFLQESKLEDEVEKAKKTKVFVASVEEIKYFEANPLEDEGSDDLTYTLEGTAIKNTHDNVSNESDEEIPDLDSF